MIIQDAHLIQSGISIAPGMIHILSVEVDDSLEMVYGVLRFHNSLVAIVLTEKSELFEHPDHFVQLRHLQQGAVAEDIVGFVIPPSRLPVLARYANAQGFSFFSSVETMIQGVLEQEKEGHQQKREREVMILFFSL